jgi:hypothetical protein
MTNVLSEAAISLFPPNPFYDQGRKSSAGS